jgi:Flp pilus assembly protein TadG
MARHTADRRKARQRGSEILEFTFVLFGVLGFLFMTIDIAWMVFTRASLQHAVTVGARYAVVSGRSYENDPAGNVTAIKNRVKNAALGLLTGKDSLITVKWYSQQDLSTSLETAPGSGVPSPGANNQDNIVEVSVESYSSTPLVGVFHDLSPFVFTARSSDRME